MSLKPKNNLPEKINLKLKPFPNKMVKLIINDERDLYNKFNMNLNPDNIVSSDSEINPETINYLQKEIRETPRFFNISIKIRVNGRSREELVIIAEQIKTEIKKKILKLNFTEFKMRRQSFILILGGIISLAIQQIFSGLLIRYALKELLLVMAWVFMWKAVELIFFERMQIAGEIKTLKRILKSDFIF